MGVVKKGAPRILLMLPPQHADPRLEHLINGLDMAVVSLEAYFEVPAAEKTRDPYIEMSSLILRNSLYTTLQRRIPLILDMCRKLEIDGVIDRFHVGCRTVAGDAFIVKDEIEKKLGLPVLLLEGENFDPRAYNHEQMKRRLEVFRSTLTAHAR